MRRVTWAVAVVLALSGVAMADYASTVLGLSPEGYWRMEEAEPTPGTALVNYGTAGAAGDGSWGFSGAPDSMPIAVAGPGAGDGFLGLPEGNQAGQLVNNSGSTYHQFNLGNATFMNNESQSYAFLYRHDGDASTSGERLIVNDQGMDNDFRVVLYGHQIVVCTGTGYGTYDAVATSPDLYVFMSAWNHAVVVRNGDAAYDAELYVNGVKYALGSAPDSFSKYTGGDANIGARFPWDNGWGNYTGYVDEVATFGRALGQEDVDLLYEALTTAGAITGDVNGDGIVDYQDLGIMAGNWNMTSGADLSMGDLNGDGAVDYQDLGIMAGNWNYGVTATGTVVPEPATMGLLAIGGIAALIRRRRS
jgi:hypothetical protein